MAFRPTNRDNRVRHRESIPQEYTFHSYTDTRCPHTHSSPADHSSPHLSLRDSFECHHRSLANRDTTPPNHIPMSRNKSHRHTRAPSADSQCAWSTAIPVSPPMFPQRAADIRSSFQMMLVEDTDREIHLSSEDLGEKSEYSSTRSTLDLHWCKISLMFVWFERSSLKWCSRPPFCSHSSVSWSRERLIVALGRRQ